MTDARDALARLYDAHAGAAYGFLLRMVHDAPWAEDLLQESFLRVASRLAELREPAAARAYLWRTATHLALDGLRRRRRLPSVPLDAVDEPTDGGARDSADAAERADAAAAVSRAVAALAPRERAAVLLRTAARLTFGEMGEAMGLTDRGAARLYEAGLERLRRGFGVDRSEEDRDPGRRMRHESLER